jgi:hypothetical protein
MSVVTHSGNLELKVKGVVSDAWSSVFAAAVSEGSRLGVILAVYSQEDGPILWSKIVDEAMYVFSFLY